MGNFKGNNKKSPAKGAGTATKKSLPPFKGMKKADTKVEKIIKKESESESSSDDENAMDVTVNQANHLNSSSSSSEAANEIVVAPKKSVAVKKAAAKESSSSESSSEEDKPVNSIKPSVASSVNVNNNNDNNKNKKQPQQQNATTKSDKKNANENQFHANYSLMLSNLDSGANAEELRQFLINKGIPVEGFHFITTPFAILQIPTLTDLEQIRTKLQGKKYKAQELCCVKVDGNVSRMLVNKTTLPGTIHSKTVLFASRIPADCTKEDIKNLLPKTIDGSACTIVINNHKFKKNIAVSVKLSFENESQTKSALAALNGKEIRGMKLTVTYGIEKANQSADKAIKDLPTNEDLRGKTATFLVRNLPSTTNYAKMKTLFPSGVRFEIVKRSGQSNNCFVQFEDAEICSKTFDENQDKEVDGQPTKIAFVPTRSDKKKPEITDDQLGTQLKISNLPFCKSQEDLVKEFPTAASVFLKTNNMKKSVGSCILTFNSKEDCIAVFNACKKKAIEGRPLRCEPWSEALDKNAEDSVKNNAANNQFAVRLFNLPFEAEIKDIKKSFPKAVRVTILKDINTGKPRGMAVVNFNTNAECEEALKKCPTSMIGGRKIRGERQVDIKAGEKLTLLSEKKSKEEQNKVTKEVVPQTKKVKNEPEEEEDDEESEDEEEEEEESSDEEIVKPGTKRSFKEISKSTGTDSKKAKTTAKPSESSDDEDDDDDESDEEDEEDSDD